MKAIHHSNAIAIYESYAIGVNQALTATNDVLEKSVCSCAQQARQWFARNARPEAHLTHSAYSHRWKLALLMFSSRFVFSSVVGAAAVVVVFNFHDYAGLRDE